MKKGVIKASACCLAGVMALGGNSVISLAAGLDMPLAGLESKLQEQQQKAAAETVQVAASGYDTIAIAQLDDPEGYVNIRDAASAEEGNVLGKLYDESAATILGQEGDWYLIQSGSVTGYVKAEFFATGAEAEELAKEVGTQVATVNTTTLMVRQEASTDSEVLALVGDSQSLQVVEDQGDWVKVAVDSDVVGYVSKDYVECETQFVEAESNEEEAARIKAEEEAYLAALEEARRADEEAAAQAAAQEAQAEQEYLELMQQQAAEAEAAAQAAAEQAAQAQAEAEAQAQAQADAEAQAQAQAEAEAAAQAAADAQAAAEAAAAEEAAAQAAAEQAQAEAAAQAQADAAAQAEQEAVQETESTEESTSSDTSSTSSVRQSVVNFALQFVGNPYVWGGTSLTNGADCSGFTQSVLANFGVSIPRTAGAQSQSGTPVSVSDVQPGDLLFYSGSGDYGIGHVSMYIGNGQVVHASNSSTGIIVSDMGYRTPTSARSYL